MLRKMISLLIVVSTFVLLVVPVSADDGDPSDVVSYNVNDFISGLDVDGINDIMSVVVPYKYNRWYTNHNGTTSNYVSGAAVYDVPLIDDDTFTTGDPSVVMTIAYNPLGSTGAYSYFDVSSLPSSTVFSLNNIVITVISKGRSDRRSTFIQEFSLQYYDVNGGYLGTQRVDREHLFTASDVGPIVYDLRDVSFNLEKPQGAKYAKFRMLLKFHPVYFARDYSSLTVDIDNFMFSMSITDAERQLLKENADLLNEVKEQLKEQQATQKENGEKLDGIIDSLEKAPEKEQNAATDGGNKNVGEILDVIPNESQGFMNALSSFSQAFSYEGTDAILPIPAIRLPEIPGVIPSFTILESQDFDLGAFVDFLPEGLVLLVQSLLTIALIVYCFKELYDTIAYVMTLRKGE